MRTIIADRLQRIPVRYTVTLAVLLLGAFELALGVAIHVGLAVSLSLATVSVVGLWLSTFFVWKVGRRQFEDQGYRW